MPINPFSEPGCILCHAVCTQIASGIKPETQFDPSLQFATATEPKSDFRSLSKIFRCISGRYHKSNFPKDKPNFTTTAMRENQ